MTAFLGLPPSELAESLNSFRAVGMTQIVGLPCDRATSGCGHFTRLPYQIASALESAFLGAHTVQAAILWAHH
jgi:hypothetical protein